MRTTLSIEDDVAARLQQLAQQRGISFKQAVNDALRAGLRRPGRRRLNLPTLNCGGALPGIDIDRALKIDASLDTEAARQKLLSGR